MKTRGFALVLVLAAGSLLAGCASDEPYSAPQGSPSHSMRTPVVAPSGYSSPFWWPMPDAWYPFQ